MVNLAEGKIGQDAANLLGGLLLTSLGLAAYSRSDIPESQRRPFFIYADECHNFTTLSSASMMPEQRKYGVGMVFANQYLTQLNADVRDAVLGNAGSLVSFRVGVTDAKFIENEFCSKFDANDITSLANYEVYVRVIVSNSPTDAFSGVTIVY